MIRTSGKLTPAALTSITTSSRPSTRSACSSITRVSGNPHALQTTAFMVRRGWAAHEPGPIPWPADHLQRMRMPCVWVGTIHKVLCREARCGASAEIGTGTSIRGGARVGPRSRCPPSGLPTGQAGTSPPSPSSRRIGSCGTPRAPWSTAGMGRLARWLRAGSRLANPGCRCPWDRGSVSRSSFGRIAAEPRWNPW
jgi:hypothetical protein